VAATIAVVLCVAAAVGLQVQVAHTDAEFLTRPVRLGPDSELVAVRLARRTLSRHDTLDVTLYVRGKPPANISLGVISAAFTAGPQPVPDLSERSLSTSGLHAREETIVPPAFAQRSPGTYALHVAGSPVTFGVFGVVG
jgi:hypothetical protein